MDNCLDWRRAWRQFFSNWRRGYDAKNGNCSQRAWLVDSARSFYGALRSLRGQFIPRRYWSVAQAFAQVIAPVVDDYAPRSALFFLGSLYLVQYVIYVFILLAGFTVAIHGFRVLTSRGRSDEAK